MSSKPRKKKAEPAPAAKPRKETPRRPPGKVPEAMVVARHGSGTLTRRGRGYSSGELSEAMLSPRLATGWGLSVDVRRRSVLQGNVESLKRWGSHSGQEVRAVGAVKKVEEELRQVEKEVEKEAREVKKEVLKVEKEVRKEAAKAEKAVRAKAKPKTRAKKKTKK